MTSYDAARLAQTLKDVWFRYVGNDHDGYPDVYVVLDGRYLDVDHVTYDGETNVIEVGVVPDAGDDDR